MPYADPDRRRRANRENMRRLRARRKAESAAKRRPVRIPKPPADPAGAVQRWSRRKLRVPPGHPRAGRPLSLPAYGVAFLRDALADGVRESLLCVARKNAKSAVIAVYLLAKLVGPLRVRGWRGGVVSISKEKAGELKRQMQEIAEASGLEGLRFMRSPAPGRVESETGTLDILAADRSAGHASGFDDSVIDELGLLQERDRELIHGMRTAISARDGRFLALSIHGDGPFIPEILERRSDPAVAVHLYQAPPDAPLDDPAGWAAANPGLASRIKSKKYMQDESRRVLATPADQAAFKAHDLNLPQAPSVEMIVSVSDWQECVVPVEDRPPREGPCFVGLDAGGSASFTALVAVWPNGRTETWAAVGDVPDLMKRGKADGVGGLYQRMYDRGELLLYSGRVTPVGEFVKDCARRLAGCEIRAAGADRYRRAEVLGALEAAKVRWPMVWRGTGAHAHADGSHDVRSFQKGVIGGFIRTAENLVLAHAISESVIRRDPAGNPALDKQRKASRIDALSAGVIAAGLERLHRIQKPRGGRYLGAA